MPYPLLRPLLIFEFLVAIEAIFTFWSQVGGQYHLDLMYWPWKFGLSIVAALLITAITAALVKSGGTVTGRIWALGTLLVATFAIAGLVTYYYHLHEPSDEDDTGNQTTVTWNCVTAPSQSRFRSIVVLLSRDREGAVTQSSEL